MQDKQAITHFGYGTPEGLEALKFIANRLGLKHQVAPENTFRNYPTVIMSCECWGASSSDKVWLVGKSYISNENEVSFELMSYNDCVSEDSSPRHGDGWMRHTPWPIRSFWAKEPLTLDRLMEEASIFADRLIETDYLNTMDQAIKATLSKAKRAEDSLRRPGAVIRVTDQRDLRIPAEHADLLEQALSQLQESIWQREEVRARDAQMLATRMASAAAEHLQEPALADQQDYIEHLAKSIIEWASSTGETPYMPDMRVAQSARDLPLEALAEKCLDMLKASSIAETATGSIASPLPSNQALFLHRIREGTAAFYSQMETDKEEHACGQLPQDTQQGAG